MNRPNHQEVIKNANIQGDCLLAMKTISDNYIDLTVTSPPYDDLRTYNNSLVWGKEIWQPIIRELYRVTKKGGVVVWVVGDATNKGSETGTSFAQALFFKEIGFNLHDTMIYEKNSSSFPAKRTGNRYTQIFEYMFVFSKGKPKTVNLLCDKPNKWAGHTNWGENTQYDKNGNLKKTGNIKPVPEFSPRNNIWKYTVGFNGVKGHPAVFPLKLAEDHILTWSNEGDIVLDPFAGSGTTGVACINTKRNYIMIEKEEKYCDIIRQRLNFKERKNDANL